MRTPSTSTRWAATRRTRRTRNKSWLAALNEAFEGFCDALERGRDTWLDPYAAEHPSEFFAVLSEAFFQQPKETQRRYPNFYD